LERMSAVTFTDVLGTYRTANYGYDAVGSLQTVPFEAVVLQRGNLLRPVAYRVVGRCAHRSGDNEGEGGGQELAEERDHFLLMLTGRVKTPRCKIRHLGHPASKPDHFVLMLSRKVKTRTLQKPKHAAPES
jgi:hypothetical protein